MTCICKTALPQQPRLSSAVPSHDGKRSCAFKLVCDLKLACCVNDDLKLAPRKSCMGGNRSSFDNHVYSTGANGSRVLFAYHLRKIVRLRSVM